MHFPWESKMIQGTTDFTADLYVSAVSVGKSKICRTTRPLPLPRALYSQLLLVGKMLSIQCIGVGRFRILGGPRFRILGGPRGANSQQAHDVVMTSMRRNDVASTSFRRHVPTRFLTNQCQIITFLILKPDIIENSRLELRGIVLLIIILPFYLIHFVIL